MHIQRCSRICVEIAVIVRSLFSHISRSLLTFLRSVLFDTGDARAALFEIMYHEIAEICLGLFWHISRSLLTYSLVSFDTGDARAALLEGMYNEIAEMFLWKEIYKYVKKDLEMSKDS